MKSIAFPLAAATLLLAGCNRTSDDALIRNAVGNTLAPQGNVQDVSLTKGADNNYSGTATVRRPDGRPISFNCTARRNEAAGQYDIACGQRIDQTLLDELEANMRRSLEGQGVTVAELHLNRQDDDHVTGFAQVSDPNSGESARLVCTGARQGGGRIQARCDVPGGPAPAAGNAAQAGDAPPAE